MRFISNVKYLCVILTLLASLATYGAEPPTEPILRIDPGEHTAIICRIAADEQGRYLATASEDKTVRLWDLASGRLLSTLRPPQGLGDEGKLYAVAMSPDGAIVAAAGWTQFNNGSATSLAQDGYSIYLFDRATGRLLRRLPGLPNVIAHLAFSPDGRYLAATLGGKNGVRVFAAASGQLLAEDRDYGGHSYSAHFSDAKGETRLLTTSRDGLLRLYRFDGNRLTLLAKCAAPGGKQPYAARFSPDGQGIAVGFEDTPAVNVLDGNSLKLCFAPDTAGANDNLGNVAWSRDGKTLFAAGSSQKTFNGQYQHFIRRWTEGGAGVASDWPVAVRTIFDLAPLPSGRLAFSNHEPAWGVVGAAGNKTVFHAPAVADFRGNWDGFALSPDGAQVRFGYEVFGKYPVIFDIQRRTFLPENTSNLVAPLLAAPDVTVTDWKGTTAPKLNGNPLKLEDYETSRSLSLWSNGDGFALGADWSLRAFARDGTQRWVQPSPGVVWGVNVSRDGRWVVAAYGDGTIRWHRARDGAEQLVFYPHPDKKRWVMWTPAGYYDASPGADDLIGWHVNRGKDQAADFFPASRFRERFYRPDVLARVLVTQDEATAMAQANEASGRSAKTVSIAQVLPPVVEILSPDDGAEVSKPTITLKYFPRTPDDAPLTGIRVRVNGQAVSLPGGNGFAAAKPTGVREVAVPIPPRDNVVQLFAENKNGVSVPATVRLAWAGGKVAAEQKLDIKRKLYVLAVGVSKYKNPDYNLGLAAKDAADFVQVLKKQKGGLYGDVQVRLLTDDKASRDDVVDGLEWLKNQVTQHDVGMMFLAGHGKNDNNGKYYFLPHNAEADKLMRTGISQHDIRDTLNSLAGKVLFFIDTCYSGNAIGTGKVRAMSGANDAFVAELASAENGVIVFSACTGQQFSLEDTAWGNGAFTKAVVEGLNGKADIGNSGKITHKGLDYYVTGRVKELTSNQQTPVSIAPNGITDFPIALTEK